jgi:hypothetical protein
MSDVFEKLADDLKTLAEDIQTMVYNEKKKEEEKAKGSEGKSLEEKRLRSLQQVTTFYSSKKEAIEVNENPIIAFIDKRLKEIF